MTKRKYLTPYPREFPEQIAQLASMGDRSMGAMAEDFGVSREAVPRWERQAPRLPHVPVSTIL